MTPRRRESMHALLLVAGLLPCLLHAQPALPTPVPEWLQVEIVVFRQLDTTLAADERWPAQPELSYPDVLGFLLEPDSPAHAAALAEREIGMALALEEGGAQPDTPLELPRVRLAAGDAVLAEAASRIRGSPHYHLLAHHAWRQPAPEPGSAEHVLVTGGASVGEHFELEGYLTLARSRFWHVETRLWLNDFASAGTVKTAQTPTVVLPAVPQPPLPPPLVAPADGPASVDEVVLPVGEVAVPDPVRPAPIEAEAPRPLRTVLLQAARRVNPGDIHYFDHPLFGVLVTLRPYDPVAATIVGEEANALNAPPATAPPVAR